MTAIDQRSGQEGKSRMIELPEAVTLARQITEELGGKVIASGTRGNAPHKFAFYNHTPEEYAALFQGKTVGASQAYGSLILTALKPEHVLILGGGGERILHHRSAEMLPSKHQLWLHFADDTYLTVTVSGWGCAQLMHTSQIAKHLSVGPGAGGIMPTDPAFTWDYFQTLFGQLEEADSRSLKFFVISKPGILGVGNGYLQDILFRAKLHPRRKVITTTPAERRALYDATCEVIRQAVALGGRDTEFDLHNQPGGYRRILDSRSVGQPCPVCGTPIEKASYLGGAIYFCAQCQV
jgi:formamidopyrimidine-DNA glycosylase